MKKNIIYFLVLPIFILLITIGIGSIISSHADSSEFVITDSVLTGYTGEGGAVVIPGGVTKIGQEVFANNMQIKSVVIPDSVNEIGYRAFASCNNLCSVSIGDGVEIIGDSAFNGDINLSEVSIGSGLLKFGNGAFTGCINLLSVRFSKNPNFICEDGVIYNASKTKILQYLAGRGSNVYIMPSTVTDIARYAFWGADKVEEIRCSSGLMEVPDYAFSNCKSLKNVVLYAPLRAININSFSNDSALMQVICPVSLGKIHSSAFTGCPSDMIFVCDSGTYAEKYALENGYLTSTSDQVKIENRPAAVLTDTASGNNLADNSASDISQLKPINTQDEPSQNDSDASNQNVLNQGNIFQDIYSTDDGLEISRTQVVSDRAFIGIDGIKVASISFDGSSKSDTIGDYAYYGDNITNFDFAPGIKNIGKLAFARSNLTSISIPDGVESIDYAAFYHCDNLAEVQIPATVTYVGEHVFDYTAWYNNWLNDPESDDFLIVGNGVLIGYKGHTEEVTIPDTVKTIAPGVF